MASIGVSRDGTMPSWKPSRSWGAASGWRGPGGADTTLALATGSVRELLGWLREHGRPDGMARDR